MRENKSSDRVDVDEMSKSTQKEEGEVKGSEMIVTKDGHITVTGSDEEVLADIGVILKVISREWDVSIAELLWTVSAMTYCCQEEDEDEEEGEGDDEGKFSEECSREEMESAMQRRLRERGSHYRRG